ncbi:M48 family metalloprotease [Sphingomonas parva]|uniref:M48 family metalloprotease n=1 Tax=Sphingomonas parva TaxID=2555898 RepID=UPI001431476B|nr:M48 family metalloprotease [Sphingomonas parva]
MRTEDARVAAVAYRLALAGETLCPEPSPLTGMLFHHLAEYLPADRLLMIERYGLDRGPGVLTVLAGSPAEQAGLVAGDVLLKVNGRPLPTGASIAADPERKSWRRRIEATEAQLEAELRKGAADIVALREGRELRLTLGSRPGCPARVRLARSPLPQAKDGSAPPTDRLERLRLARDKDVNAFVTDGRVTITTAMLDFIENDDELALILAHEMGHLILKHPPMHEGDKLLASIGIRSGTFWKREEAADRLGIRLLAAAGYDVEAVIPFWRRFLRAYDTPQIFRYHPSLGARERIAREEIQAIRAARPSL